MSKPLVRVASLAAAAALAGCRAGPADTPQGGAPPPLATHTGPIPGPQLLLSEPQNPFHGDRVAIAAGRVLFAEYNCSGCHGDHAGGGMAPSLRDDVWLYGNSDAQIFASIAEGRNNGMPAWGVKVPQEQIWKLVAYLQTLRTSDEPEAPDQALPREPIP